MYLQRQGKLSFVLDNYLDLLKCSYVVFKQFSLTIGHTHSTKFVCIFTYIYTRCPRIFQGYVPWVKTSQRKIQTIDPESRWSQFFLVFKYFKGRPSKFYNNSKLQLEEEYVQIKDKRLLIIISLFHPQNNTFRLSF